MKEYQYFLSLKMYLSYFCFKGVVLSASQKVKIGLLLLTILCRLRSAWNLLSSISVMSSDHNVAAQVTQMMGALMKPTTTNTNTKDHYQCKFWIQTHIQQALAKGQNSAQSYRTSVVTLSTTHVPKPLMGLNESINTHPSKEGNIETGSETVDKLEGKELDDQGIIIPSLGPVVLCNSNKYTSVVTMVTRQ